MVAAILIACGGPTGGGPGGGDPGPTEPLPPTITELSTTVAARGETISISGTDFGDNAGSLTIGGVPATITAWTATAVEATVPETAPNGWTEVSLSAPGGVVTQPDFFVGAEFTGEAADLQEFLYQQTPGSAVLLGATDYDLTATRYFLINNIHLYGRGADSTTVLLDATGAYGLILMYVDYGAGAGLTDLSITGGGLAVFSGSVDHIDALPLSASSLGSSQVQDAFSSLPSTLEFEIAARGSLPSVVFDRVNLDFTGLFAVGFIQRVAANAHITDSVISVSDPSGGVGVTIVGDAQVTGSELEAPQLHFSSYGNSLRVHETELLSAGGIQIAAQTGLVVTDSTLHAANGNIEIAGDIVARSLSSMPGGPVTITGSVLRALDADLTDAAFYGTINMATTDAVLTVTDNPTIRAMFDLNLEIWSNIFTPIQATFARNTDVHVGVFTTESATHWRAGRLEFLSGTSILQATVEFTDNNLTVSGSVDLEAIGPGQLIVTDNETEIGDENMYGGFYVYSDGSDVPFAGNIVRVADVLWFGMDGAPENTLLIADNRVDAWRSTSIIGSDGLRFGQMLVTSNSLKSGNGLYFSNAAEIVISSNVLTTGASGIEVFEDAAATVNHLTLEGNEIAFSVPTDWGTYIWDIPSVAIAGNSFSMAGTPAGPARALSFEVSEPNVQIDVSGNNFTGFTRALYLNYIPGASNLAMTMNHNVFDFEVSAPRLSRRVRGRDG